MATLATIGGANAGTALQTLLMADDIVPGSQPGYETCKAIFLYHPLGSKVVEKPIKIAMSQKRKIAIPDAPEDRAREAFEAEWKKLKCDEYIYRTAVLAAVYGIDVLALVVKDEAPEKAVDYKSLWKKKIAFKVFDPLNAAGSLVTSQDPNAIDFQSWGDVAINGKTYHASKTRVLLNEFPVYLDYSASAFGFTGRSAYQRALFPLKSFITGMVTDDLVERKVGVLVAKMVQAGSIVTNGMMKMFGLKRNVVKEAETNNVISISPDEMIESLNLQNLDGPHALARKHIIENIASAVPMPAKMLTDESFAEGFGEGTEDAKDMARFIDGIRERLDALYDFMDTIVQYRAWNPEFYATIQEEFPDEYSGVDYDVAFIKWCNSFHAEWPSLLKEPESELIKVADVKLRGLIAAFEALKEDLPPEERARAAVWVADNFSEMKELFGNPLILDQSAIEEFLGEKAEREQESHASELEANESAVEDNFKLGNASRSDSAVAALRSAVAVLPDRKARRAAAR